MDLTHRFSIAAPLDQIWAAFNRIEVIAPCFPGASLSSVDRDRFAGTIKVKFGPVSMAYNGYGSYLKRDERRHQLVVEGRGLDRRGHGTASALVTATFTAGHSTTDVEVLTELTLTGKPAQFGHSVIADISDRLLEQFVSNLAVEVAEHGGHWGQPDGRSPEESATPASSDAAPQDGTGGPGAPAGAPPRVAWTFSPPSNDNSRSDVDVLRTVAPVVLRRVGPLLAALTVLWLLANRLRRRRSS